MAVLLDGNRCDLGWLRVVPPPLGALAAPWRGHALDPLQPACDLGLGARMVWGKLGQSLCLLLLWEKSVAVGLLWCGCSEPGDSVRWQDPAHGPWQTQCSWWLCPGCSTHPSPAPLALPLSPLPLFGGSCPCPGIGGLHWHPTVPLTSCKAHEELSFQEPAPGRWTVAGTFFHLQEKAGLASRTFFPREPPGAVGVSPWGRRSPHWPAWPNSCLESLEEAGCTMHRFES